MSDSACRFALEPGSDGSPVTRGPGTPSTVSGVTTTRVAIASFVKGPFTISGTVTSQQSGTLQKITFSPTTITANANAGCNTTATNPCRIEVIGTSHWSDFPLAKTTNVGYPAGVYMAGSFTGTQAASPNGDTISMTAEASGLKATAGTSPGTISDSDRRRPRCDQRHAGRRHRRCSGVVAVVLHRHLDVQVHGDKLDEVVQHPDHRDGAAQV